MLPPPSDLLPELREELQLVARAGPDEVAPSWLVVDTLQHRYIEIDEQTHAILTLWRNARAADALVQQAREIFGLVIEVAQIRELTRFLESQHLTVDGPKGWRGLWALELGRRQTWWQWLLHHYLFVRIPLARPEKELRRLLPLVAPLYTRTCAIVVALFGIVGLYLASRQWDQFTGTFPHFFSIGGIFAYGLAIVFVKALHELGHAFTALRYGCRVPSMGICLMVLMPVLYTDVTDAWRLERRRQRLAIDAAGMVVELGIACVALFLWSFLPEGAMRSAAFVVATTSLLLSLGINLNPFMRFDGYYLLADFTGIANLQPRSFAVGVWRLREMLFGLGAPCPERLTRLQINGLTLYAWCVWLYRLVLFTGIALMVYHLSFKLLGIVLFLVEIVVFVAGPVFSEIRAWWALREKIAVARGRWRAMLVFATCVAGLIVPWSSAIEIPAVLEAAELARIFPPRAADVVEVRVHAGKRVAAGDIVAVLRSPETEFEQRRAERRLDVVRLRLARRAGDAKDLADTLVLEDEERALEARLAGLAREQAEFVVRAPFAGEVVEINAQITRGRAIARTEQIALLRGDAPPVARGYLREQDLARVDTRATGRFVAEEVTRAALPVQIVSIAHAGAGSLELAELASINGGSIAVRPLSDGAQGRRLVPVQAQYFVTLALAGDSWPEAASRRGVALVQATPESLLARVWRQSLRVLVRESGV